jgi:hypothetical protein
MGVWGPSSIANYTAQLESTATGQPRCLTPETAFPAADKRVGREDSEIGNLADCAPQVQPTLSRRVGTQWVNHAMPR